MDIARANRLDWMNNRMCAGRHLAADLLQRQPVEIGAQSDLRRAAEHDEQQSRFDFNGIDRNAPDVGVQFSAPLTRRLQRNNFRAQLISYQQARRGLIQYQDSIYQVMRNYLRSLKQLELLLEIQRRAMVIAVRRADQTRELLNQPPEPAARGRPEAAQLLPPTAAQNLLFALSDLRNVQNNFMSAWLNHYETRMMLYRDLGIMELDDEGMWIDRPLNESDWLEEESVRTASADSQSLAARSRHSRRCRSRTLAAGSPVRVGPTPRPPSGRQSRKSSRNRRWKKTCHRRHRAKKCHRPTQFFQEPAL